MKLKHKLSLYRDQKRNKYHNDTCNLRLYKNLTYEICGYLLSASYKVNTGLRAELLFLI
jgi:hypothetical protein